MKCKTYTEVEGLGVALTGSCNAFVALLVVVQHDLFIYFFLQPHQHHRRVGQDVSFNHKLTPIVFFMMYKNTSTDSAKVHFG